MPITLFDAVRRVRSRVNEPATPTTVGGTNPRQFTDTELTDWINDACRDIARRAEDLHTYDTTITIPPYNQISTQPIPTYPLQLGPQVSSPSLAQQSSDVLRITRVEFFLNALQVYPLEWQPQQFLDQIWNINQASQQSYPTWWTTRGYPGGTGRSAFVIQLYPQPSQGGSLNVFYYRLPLRIADPVTNPANYMAPLEVIEGWDDLVIDYACAQALFKQRSPDYQVAQQMYEAKLQNLIDQTRYITDQATYMTYDNVGMPWVFDSWGSW